MTINWKVRFKNKVWLASFIGAIVTFVFTMLELFGVVPGVTEDLVMQGVKAILVILAGVGVLVDPTTKGMSDSERALAYEEPD